MARLDECLASAPEVAARPRVDARGHALRASAGNRGPFCPLIERGVQAFVYGPQGCWGNLATIAHQVCLCADRGRSVAGPRL